MEEWRSVVGYEGRYDVSDKGNVRRTGYATYLSTFPSSKRSYPAVELHNGVGGKRKRTVHTLVLEAFVGPRPEGMLGLHNDDIPDHNTLDNLRWGTYSENIEDCIKAGNGVQYVTKLSDAQVRMVKDSALPDKVLALELGVSSDLINKIRRGKKRRGVT